MRGAFGLVVVAALAAPASAESQRTPIKGDEEVVLFTTAAARDGDAWVVPVHGWVFEPERRSVWRGATVTLIGNTIDLADDDPRNGRLSAVARWFLVDNERGKRLPVAVGDALALLPPTGADGHARTEVRVPVRDGQQWITIEARARDGRRFLGRAQMVAPRGVSVVSDIDDTIKVTEVLAGKGRILERTFLEPFEPVAGMAARYDAWRGQGAVFHYVSASPWHLYPLLSEFLAAAGFPAGTLALREFRVKDGRRFNLLKPARRHKLAAIGALVTRFPGRRFVLVGDSGESDPEIYGEVARRYPRQIAAIAIRRLPGDRYSAARQKRAFAGVKARVLSFSRAEELPGLAELAP